MTTNETALILVRLDDSTDMVIAKVLGAGVANVQILVPDGAKGLRTVAETNRLRQVAEEAQIDLSLVSSDAAIIGAAWVSRLQILVVCNTHVVAADSAPHPTKRPASQPNDRAKPVSAPPPAPQPPASPSTPPHVRSQTTPRQRTDHQSLHNSAEIPHHAPPRPKGRVSNRPRPRRNGGSTR